MLKILYCNLRRSRRAYDSLVETGERIKADILICSEPNKSKISGDQRWAVDPESNAAVLVSGMTIMSQGHGNGFAWVTTNAGTFFGAYISPNVSEEIFARFIVELREAVRKVKHKCVIFGDFNSKHTCWGSSRSDRRGKRILEWTAGDLLCIHNRGTTPTLRRQFKDKPDQTSYIDLTITTSDIANDIRGWCVREDIESLSDHNYIVATLDHSTGKDTPVPARLLRFRPERAADFMENIRAVFTHNTPESIDEFIQTLKSTCKKFFASRPGGPSKQVYWWCEDVKVARKECHSAKRKLCRNNSRTRHPDPQLYNDYKTKRGILRNAIRKAKTAAFDRLLEEVNSDPWGNAYKVVTAKHHPRINLSLEIQKEQARKLFPSRPAIKWKDRGNSPSQPFTLEELNRAITKTPPGKAPGPDGITGEMMRLVYTADPQTTLLAFNLCLRSGCFPREWKQAELRLLPKPSKPGQPPSYRPICLLSVVGKVMEQLIKGRMSLHIEPILSPLQFGYRPKKSPVDAVRLVISKCKEARMVSLQPIVVIILMDIRNAFNTARWEKIIQALEEMQTPEYLVKFAESYFTDRTLIVANETQGLTCGVPQGSVLGPLLWNVLYNSIVALQLPNVDISVFADDLGFVVRGPSVETTELYIELAVETITLALERIGLELAPEKTEAMIVFAPRRITSLRVTVLGHNIPTKTSLKYLGVWLERGLRCRTHINQILGKAVGQVHALNQLMRIDGPVRQPARHLFGTVIYCRIMYAAPAWSVLIRTKREHKSLESASRQALLRICAALPTVSTPAAEVIAGVPPISLRLAESTHVYEGMDRPLARERTMREWQVRWTTMYQDKAVWTRRLIANIGPWVSRTHGHVDRFITQLLSGHGEFKKSMARFGAGCSELCDACGLMDSAEHAFFECWEVTECRDMVAGQVGRCFTPDTCVSVMLSSLEGWEAVQRFAQMVVLTREGRLGGAHTRSAP